MTTNNSTAEIQPDALIQCIDALEESIRSVDEKLFRNPDKETVLTPWRVVNMHMGDCIGGYSFCAAHSWSTRRTELPSAFAQWMYKNIEICETKQKKPVYC